MPNVTKQYKKKLYIECNDSDKDHRQDIRKSLNSSERQRGNSLAVSGLRDHEDTKDVVLIRNLRWTIEEKLSDECYRKERCSPANLLNQTLQRLGIGWFKLHQLHKCDCPNPDDMSDEEILKLSGY